MNTQLNLMMIRDVAKKKKVNLKYMCEELGFSYQSLNHNINTGFMDAGRLVLIANYLEVSPLLFIEKGITQESIIEEQKVKYGIDKKKQDKEYHCGKIIENRLESIGMTQAQLAQILETSKQNISKLLKTKTIDIEKLTKINEVLNPTGSTPWDIFAFFSREAEEPVEEKYVKLLEEHIRFRENYERLLSKYNIKGDFID